jgi:multidrug transporter EmrE-like cation transporter
MINVAGLALITLTLSIGQVLFKKVGLSVQGVPVLDGLLIAARQPALYVGLTLYGGATLLWIWILSRVPLSQAYPWVAAGTAIVPFLGWYLYGERLSPVFWVGVALIMAGIVVIQYGIPGP